MLPFQFPAKKPTPFPLNGAGEFLLDRERVVEPIVQDILYASEGASFYFRGPKGSGKTLFLQLIGQTLSNMGEKVMWIENAHFLVNEIRREELVHLSDSCAPGKRVYLLIDEVHDAKHCALWTYLLKGSHSLVPIGAGIPGLGSSPAFQRKFDPSFLLFTVDDLHETVISYFRSVSTLKLQQDGVDSSCTRDVLEWVLAYTGGHAYPFVQLAHYLLSFHPKACKEGRMEEVVLGVFFDSDVYKKIVSRCFDVTGDVKEAVFHIITKCTRSARYESMLFEAGLWNGDEKWLLSGLLLNHIFRDVLPPQRSLRDFKEVSGFSGFNLSDPAALDDVVLYAFSLCSAADFLHEDGTYRYENSISCAFTEKLARIPQLYVSAQCPVPKMIRTRGQSPTIDLFINGTMNKYLEFVRNGLQLQDHFDKFESPSGPYHRHRERYAIVDFQLRGREKAYPVHFTAPEGRTHIGPLYRFYVQSNTLYKDGVLLKCGVSMFLPTPPPGEP